MKSITRQAQLPRWVWPLALVVAAVVLATLGRYLVAGMFVVIAVAFVLTLVSAVVWGLLAMAGPGSRGALRGQPGSVRHPRARARQARLSVLHRVGQAPWRSPKRIVQLVMDQIAGEVFQLPSGPAAYRHLRVRMHPETLQMLDRWMPIEDVAKAWAEHYIDTHRATRGLEDSVTVSICGSEELPRGRALIAGSFRVHPDGPDTWARARRSIKDQQVDPGEVVRLRSDDPVDQQQSVDTREAVDQTQLLDPDATMRFPAPTAGPAAAHPSAPHSSAADEHTDLDQTQLLDPDATMGSPASSARATATHASRPHSSAVESHTARDQTAQLDPGATRPVADAGARPAGANPGATHAPGRGAPKAHDQGRHLDPEATMRFVAAGGPGVTAAGAPHDAARSRQSQAQTRPRLGFQRVHAITHRAVGTPPVLFDSPRICIGRDPGMDLMVDHRNVSREHAELRRVNDEWTILDSSKNGTALNGTGLTPGKRYPIRDGDIVAVARKPRAGTPTFRVLLTPGRPLGAAQ